MTRGSVLVVDDDPEVRDILREFLLAEGYDVELVDTAVGALGAIRARRPDVVLLDLRMPGAIPGEAVVGAISAEVPVIVITGEPDVELARQTLRDGAFDFVMKPFALRRVGELVAAAVLHGTRGPSADGTA